MSISCASANHHHGTVKKVFQPKLNVCNYILHDDDEDGKQEKRIKESWKNIFHSFDFFHFSPLSVMQLPTTMLVHLCDGFKFMVKRV